MDILELETKPLADLRKIGKDLDIPRANRLKKEALLVKIRQTEAANEGLEIRGGILEIMNEGIGFLRFKLQDQLRRRLCLSGTTAPPCLAQRRYGHRPCATPA